MGWSKGVCSVGCVLLCVSQMAWAEVPPSLSHQGVIAVNGVRFSGDGAFRFALVDADTDAYLWVNDGSVVGSPDAPTDAVTLQVINGVYQLRLGDTSLANMTALPVSVFNENDNVVLRIWFDDGRGNGMHQLSPDQPIGSVPFTHHAGSSERLNIPGEDTSAVFVGDSGNVGIGTTAPGGRLEIQAPAGEPTQGQIHIEGNGGSGVGDAFISFAEGTEPDSFSMGVRDNGDEFAISKGLTLDNDPKFVIDYDSGNVGIGTTTPEGTLEVAGGDDGAAVISGFNTSTLFLKRDGGGFDAAMSNQGGTAPFVFYGNGATNSTDPNTLSELMRITSTGRVGIGTNNPSASLDVVGTTELNGNVGIGRVPNNRLDVERSIAGPDNVSSSYVAHIHNPNTGGDGDGLIIEIGVDTFNENATTSNNFIQFLRGPPGIGGPAGKIQGNGGFGVTYSTSGSDFAEALPRQDLEEVIKAGDVVGVFGGKISKRTAGAEWVMAVSTAPGFLGGDSDDSRGARDVVAFIGQVPVKVRGPVAIGDYIVASELGDGTAVAISPSAIALEHGRLTVGRAWEASDDEGVKQINTAVGLPESASTAAALARTVSSQQEQINELRREVQVVRAQAAELASMRQRFERIEATLAHAASAPSAELARSNAPSAGRPTATASGGAR